MKKIILAFVMVGLLFSFSPLAKASVQPSQQELMHQISVLQEIIRLTQLIESLKAQIAAILAQQSSQQVAINYIQQQQNSQSTGSAIAPSQQAPATVTPAPIDPPSCSLIGEEYHNPNPNWNYGKVTWDSKNATSGQLVITLINGGGTGWDVLRKYTMNGLDVGNTVSHGFYQGFDAPDIITGTFTGDGGTITCTTKVGQ